MKVLTIALVTGALSGAAIAVIACGSWGASEMSYSSDADGMFVIDDTDDLRYTVEPKIDGLSSSLLYEGGELVRAVAAKPAPQQRRLF